MQLVKCAICGSEHDVESMQVGFARADAELEIPPDEREKRCWGNESDFLQLDSDRWFIRGWLPVPVIGREAPFAWGVWVDVNNEDFWGYVSMYMQDGRDRPAFPGRIANHIAAYVQTLDLAVSVQMTLPADRPIVTVVDDHHPLGQEQRKGVTVDRVLTLVHRV